MASDSTRGSASRGQAHTLEAFTAALLVVSGVAFALQATAVTPLTASTSNQHVETQHRTAAADLLAVAAENGTLRPAVTFWDPERGAFVNATDRGFYTDGGPPNAFGAALNATFGDRSSAGPRIAYNVYVRARTPDVPSCSGVSGRETMVYAGSPSDNAATATRTVAVYDDTRLSGPSGETASSANGFFCDAAPNSSLYNVLEVRIVVWQM